ncbi:MAG: hypothetical protein JWM30_1194 [Burkholderia sp.]|nr:hypothetical protein [Burkholderia sp.]
MDHRSHLTQQAERSEPHNKPTSAAPDAEPTPKLPAAPSIREAPVQQPLFHVLPPPAAPHAGESSLPTLAVGMKRSAADAGLDDDAVPDGKRVKVSHANDPDMEGFQEAMPGTSGLAISRKRTASEAGLDENDLSAGKRTCQRGPNEPDTQKKRDMMAAVTASHVQEQTPVQEPCVVVPFAVDQPAQKQPGKLSSVIWRNAYEGNLPAIQAWLKTPGVDVNVKGEGIAKDRAHENALHAAILGNSVPVVRALLAMPGIDLTAEYPIGGSALQCASETTAPFIIEALLAMQGFKVSAQDFLDRHQELATAAEAGDLTQVRSLLADSPWLNISFVLTCKTALKLLARSAHLETAQVLQISPKTIVGLNASRTLRTLAVENGHLHLVQFMLNKLDFDVNENGYLGPYLVSAATKGHFPIVQALLATPGISADVTTHNGSTALLAAIRNDHHQIAIVLAALPWSMDCGDFGPALMMAADKGNFPLVRMLLAEQIIDVNVRDAKGFTPLMLAAYRGHLDIVQALLAMPGINVNLRDEDRDYRGDLIDDPIRIAGDDLLEMTGNSSSSALSLAKLANRKQIIDALLAMPESPGIRDWKLYESLRASLPLARKTPITKPAPSPEEKYCLLRQIVRPGTCADLAVASLAPNRDPLDAQRASWLEQQCMAVILGTCAASDVPFLLQSTMPLPAWCQSSLANAIALGFTAGHYRSTPAPLWQPLLQTRAWIAGLAFGAKQSRRDAIEFDGGICHQLESMGLWNGFLNAAEDLRWLKADPDAAQIDKLTMLGYAARDGDLSMIKTFIRMGANIHLRSPNGDVPIHIAAKAGQWAACAELVFLGAMPLMVDSKGYPALHYIASAFADSNTVTLALASLIRYLRLKNVRFDIAAPNPHYIELPVQHLTLRDIYYSLDEDCLSLKDEMEDESEETSAPILVSETLASNPESWVRFGKVIYGINDEPLPALPMVPTPRSQPFASSKAQVHAMVQSANAETALAAWLDENPQHLHWRDPDNDQTLLHLATASQNIGLVQLLLDRGINRTHVDRAGQTAAQLLPADYMSSYTPAAKRIAELLR